MQSISNEELIGLLGFVVSQSEFIALSTTGVKSTSDFLGSMDGMVIYNSTCMCLQTIGETIKKFDDFTDRKLLKEKYGLIPWSGVIGLRNIISHNYLATDPEIIFNTIKEDLPQIVSVVKRIIKDLEDGV